MQPETVFVWWKRRWYKNDCGWTLHIRRVGVSLEEQRSHAAHFALLFHEDLKVLVDDGHSQEDSCTRTDRAQEVGHHRQASYTEATEGSGCGDVPMEGGREVQYKYAHVIFHLIIRQQGRSLPVKLMHHGGLSVSPHHHLLLL